jgi:hypothetical protein
MTSWTNGRILNHFSAEEHSIDDPELKYVAVSYAWGRSDTMAPLTLGSQVGGMIHSTTPNAWEAVNTLGLGCLLWIDQICINQKDSNEVDMQIGLIQEVYTRCWVCPIWLGPEDEHTEAGFRFVERLAISTPSSEELPFNFDSLPPLSQNKVREKLQTYYGNDFLPPAEDPG